MASTEEGRRELAAICASYMREHKPQTTVETEPTAVPYDERAEQLPGGRPGGGGGGGGGGRGRPRRRGGRR